MTLTNEQLGELLRHSLEQPSLTPKQLPDLDLYIDQILTLFEERMGQSRRKESDKILTKSMVNNYSKEKLIRPIKGKKYSREQVLQILLIFYLKSTLSIGDIKQVMQKLMAEGQDADSLEQIFSHFEKTQESLAVLSDSILQGIGEHFGPDLDTNDLAAVLLGLSSMSYFLQRAAEQVVDRCFAPEEPSRPAKR